MDKLENRIKIRQNSLSTDDVIGIFKVRLSSPVYLHYIRGVTLQLEKSRNSPRMKTSLDVFYMYNIE